MKPTECPFCHRGLDAEEPETHYACGSAINPSPNLFRASACYEREVEILTAQLAQAQKEIIRLKRCYESATGKAVCGEGTVIRAECKEMTNLRIQLTQAQSDLTAITAHRDQLAEEVVMVLRPKLEEAEGLLREFIEIYEEHEEWFDRLLTELYSDIKVFLTPMPEAEPTPPSKSIQRRVAIQSGGDCVVVRRDDLPYYLHFAQTTVRLGGYSPKEIEVIDRLKAALTQGREGE